MNQRTMITVSTHERTHECFPQPPKIKINIIWVLTKRDHVGRIEKAHLGPETIVDKTPGDRDSLVVSVQILSILQ